MIFKDLVEIQDEIAIEWEKVKEIEIDIKEILLKYEKKEFQLDEGIEIISNPTDLGRNNDRICRYILELKRSLDDITINSSDYYFIIKDFEEKCKSLNKENIFSTDMEIVVKDLYDFFKILNNFYIMGRSFEKVKEVIISGKKAVNSIDKLDSQFNYIKKLDKVLEGDNEYLGNEILEIKISNKLSYKEMLVILNLFIEMYEMIRCVLNIEEEIEIIKIETGSLFEKIKGHPIIIQIITSALITVGNDIYENSLNPYNKSKMQIQEFKDKYNLKEILEKDGYDTSAIENDLSSLYGKLFKGSKLVMNSSSKIKINKQEFNYELKEQAKLNWTPKYLEYILEENEIND